MQSFSVISASLIVAVSMSLPCFAGQAASEPPVQMPGPDAAIHDVVHSRSVMLSPSSSLTNTDVDGDGVIDVPFFSGPEDGRLLHGGDMEAMFSGHDFRWSGLGPGSNFETVIRSGVPLNLAGQVFIAGSSSANTSSFSVTHPYIFFGNPQTRSLEQVLFLPSSPRPGIPAPDVFGHPYSMGDVDTDGFDELLVPLHVFSHPDVMGFALVDGATLTYRWVRYYNTPSFAGQVLYNSWSVPCQDIDGDGVKDIFLVGHSNANPISWYSRCVSGVDGSVIWEDIRATGDFYWGTGTASVVDDVDQDGLRDIFYWHNSDPWHQEPGYFRVQSGFDGSLIWEVSLSNFDPLYSENPPAFGLVFHRAALVTADMDGDGVRDVVLGEEDFSTTGIPSASLFYLSGVDGALLSRDEMRVASPYPWSDYAGIGNRAFFLGDIDNDGWAEFLNYTTAANSDSIFDLAVFGRRTLICPEEAHEGDAVEFGFHIPTGSGKAFRIYLSTAFDTENSGFHLGTWNTHLAFSPLLLASRFLPQLQGTLDQDGKGSISVRVPAGLGLVGQEVFAVGVVEDASMPSGVITKSTVGVITILP